MPATLANPRDEWRFIHAPVFAGGVTRGTTTSTGVLAFNVSTWAGGPARQILFGWASDEANHFRRADPAALGGTAGTMLDFQFITAAYPNVRFRVRKITLSPGGTLSSMTLATSTSGVTARYLVVGT